MLQPFNVLRYEIGQKYASHYDAFDPAQYGPQKSQRVCSSFTCILLKLELYIEYFFQLEISFFTKLTAVHDKFYLNIVCPLHSFLFVSLVLVFHNCDSLCISPFKKYSGLQSVWLNTEQKGLQLLVNVIKKPLNCISAGGIFLALSHGCRGRWRNHVPIWGGHLGNFATHCFG